MSKKHLLRLGLSNILVGVFLAPNADGHTIERFAPPRDGETVLYRNATLVDVATALVRSGVNVLTDGERVRAVFSTISALESADAAAAAKARVVNLRGQYLMPGLIDSHVHLATPPNLRQAKAILRRDIYGGVTAVRDMADDLRPVGELAREARVGEIAAPDIFYAALMAGPKLFTDPRTAQTSMGGELGHVPWMQSVTPETDLVAAVAMARGTFATAIKLYGDLSPELAEHITAEAHRQHLVVWAHATLYPAKPSDVLSAGVDTMSHACLLVREVSEGPLEWGVPHAPVDLDAFTHGTNAGLDRVFTEMARRRVILDATVWTYGPPPTGPSSSPPLPPGSCNDTVGAAITHQAYLAGVAISAGTDNTAIWRDRWPDLFHEMRALNTTAKMPIVAVLRAATLTSAQAAHQEKDMGSLEPGKLANMVVLRRNPLSSLDNLSIVTITVKRGKIYPRKEFVPLAKKDIENY